MKRTDYVYEVVLHVIHHEAPNPDEPTLNIMPLAWAMAAHAETLTSDVNVEIKSAQLIEVRA